MNNKLIQSITEKHLSSVKVKLNSLDPEIKEDELKAKNILSDVMQGIVKTLLNITWFEFLENSGPDICIRAPFYPEDVITDILRGYQDIEINALFFECNPDKIFPALSRQLMSLETNRVMESIN